MLWDDFTSEDQPGNSLSTLDLRQALHDAALATGRVIDLLYLDACLMGMWEVAYEVRDHVRYLLASESWSWTSFAYDAHLSGIGATQTAGAIGQQWLNNETEVLRRDRYPFTYSLIDLAQMAGVTTSVDALAGQLSAVATSEEGKTSIRSAFAGSACFDSNTDHEINLDQPAQGAGIDNYCDLHSLAGRLQQQFTDNAGVAAAALAVQNAVTTAVLAEAHGCGVPGAYSPIPWCWEELGGLSIYAPLGQDDWKRGLYGQLQAGRDTAWGVLLNTYWGIPAPLAPDCAAPCALPPGPLSSSHQVYMPTVWR